MAESETDAEAEIARSGIDEGKFQIPNSKSQIPNSAKERFVFAVHAKGPLQAHAAVTTSADCLWAVTGPKYLSIVLWLGGRVSSETMIVNSAEPKTMGTTVMKPFQKLTSPRGFRNKILMASLPWPSCQMTSPALCVFCR